MSIKVNPPPQVRMPEKFFNDPDVRSFFERQSEILFQLWNRTGGSYDIIGNLEQIPIRNISSNTALSASDYGSLIVVNASASDVDIIMPDIAEGDIGKSIMVLLINATNDCYVKQSGDDSILGDSSVLINGQYDAVHFTSISETEWVAR